jgi:recombination DNA repair RAD52 pathway protein
MSLTNEQIRALLQPIDPARVGKDGKGFSHIEAWDVRRTMNSIFGFATWSANVTEMITISERQVKTKAGKEAWNVVYRAKCTLQVGDQFDGGASYTEWAAGEATNPVLADAHDMAIKTAESQAFKRCAVNLGDQFGLSLYRDGSMDATVGDIIGREYADSGRVDELVLAFDEAASIGDLEMVGQYIAGLDLGKADKERLRAAYTDAKARIDAITSQA